MPSQREDAIMSKFFNLYEKVYDIDNLKISYKQTQLGSRKYRKEAILFDMARERNLIYLWRSLKNETYTPGKYIQFKVYEPKERLISAPKIRDKIVQYSCHMVLRDIYKDVYISTSYACIDGGGAHRAVDKLQHNMRYIKYKYGAGYVLKMDVRKYFYSIDRDILKSLLRKKIGDEKFLNLLYKIIDSSPEGDKGLPLGNVTSQDFANIYLNEVDQYAKRYLGIKEYVRYMDDIVIVLENKEKAREVREKIIKFLDEKLSLKTNEKTKIFPIEQGVNAYGYKIYTTHKLVRNSSKKRMKRRIKKMDEKYRNDEISLHDLKQSVNSWLGHARHSNSYNLAKKIFKDYAYIEVEHEDYKFGNSKDGALK